MRTFSRIMAVLLAIVVILGGSVLAIYHFLPQIPKTPIIFYSVALMRKVKILIRFYWSPLMPLRKKPKFSVFHVIP